MNLTEHVHSSRNLNMAEGPTLGIVPGHVSCFFGVLATLEKATACGSSEQCLTASENVPGERHPVLRKLVTYLPSQSVGME